MAVAINRFSRVEKVGILMVLLLVALWRRGGRGMTSDDKTEAMACCVGKSEIQVATLS